MVESDAIAEMRKVDGIGRLSGMIDWKGEANIVQGLMWSIASASDEGRLGSLDLDISVAKHFDGAVSEDSCAVVVAYFADG
jgi:hypothetical protein